VMPPNAPMVLVTDPGAEEEAAVRLARIGFDRVLGALVDPLRAFIEHPEVVEQLSRLSVTELDDRRSTLPNLVIVDVRNPAEVEAGAIDGSVRIGLPGLLRRLDELDPMAPTVVHCAGGYRSAIAASLLRSHGFADVSDLIGGYNAWAAHHRR
jgi:hydroxyacylglutathione hydrolase